MRACLGDCAARPQCLFFDQKGPRAYSAGIVRNPWLNLHRPGMFATEEARIYSLWIRGAWVGMGYKAHLQQISGIFAKKTKSQTAQAK